MQTLWYVLDSVGARSALTAAVLTLFSALFLSLLPLPHPSCCGGFTSSSNFQLWFYKKEWWQQWRRWAFEKKKHSPSIHQCQRAPSTRPPAGNLTPQREIQMNLTLLVRLPALLVQTIYFQSSTHNPSIRCVKFLMWFSSKPPKTKIKKKTEQVQSPVTFNAFIPTCEYLEWRLHRIMVWASGIMRFLGERGQTRGWRAPLGKS